MNVENILSLIFSGMFLAVAALIVYGAVLSGAAVVSGLIGAAFFVGAAILVRVMLNRISKY